MKAVRLILAVLILLGAASAFARTWTDSHGRQIQGKFVRYHEGNAVILRGSKAITVPFESLSEEDQKFIRTELEKKGLGDLLPSPKAIAGGLDADGRLPVPGAERTWTSNDGKQVRARLVGILGDQVTLHYQGRDVTLPMSRFSAGDQEYVKRQQARGEKKAEPARANPQPIQGNPTPQPSWQPPVHGPRFGPRPRPPMNPSPTPGWGGQPTPSPHPYTPPQPYVPPQQPYVPPQQPYTPPSQQPYSPPRFGQPQSPRNSPQASPGAQVWMCSHCRRELPSYIHAGSKCPHCGVFLAYEEDASGNITKTAPIGKIVTFGGLGSLAAVAIGLLIRFLKSD